MDPDVTRRDSPRIRAIRDYLTANPEKTFNEIADAIDYKRSEVRESMRTLARHNEVVVVDRDIETGEKVWKMNTR